ncbi:IS3 family transposase, partial [Metamycoplasma hyosynoviae]|uniref:IS3 family transposase n=1 Tax=Metamycoplasma hyosynoviae TaxID=29559 RepID=UPI00235875E9
YKSKDVKEVIKKIKKTISSNISNLKIMKILGIRKSTFYYRLKKPIKNEEVKYRKEIEQSFYECKGRYGRERLSFFLKKKYNILINPRTLGRYMSTLGLYCSIRRAKRKREKKNTNVKFNNIIQRDYDGKQNDVFATDVSYIPSPKDVVENHVYLSVLIHHKTKKIVSWNLSKNNDNFLVMKHITQTKFPKKFIIHSDHGSQYSSCEYVEFIQKNNGIISMSRIGNSLDNREIEYFFSILKTEIFPEFYQKVKTFTFNELNEIIKKFIDWYNNERFMKKFDLKTPHELWEIYKNKINWV